MDYMLDDVYSSLESSYIEVSDVLYSNPEAVNESVSYTADAEPMPGFGVGVAILALIGAGALAVGRDGEKDSGGPERSASGEYTEYEKDVYTSEPPEPDPEQIPSYEDLIDSSSSDLLEDLEENR